MVMVQTQPAHAAIHPAAVQAFDAVASQFDERFGAWRSVAAQRRAVRRELLRTFPQNAHLLELGGGTGEDALFLAAHGRRVLVTDGAPGMLTIVEKKAQAAGLTQYVRTRPVVLEELEAFAGEGHQFAGAFSNFAALNCLSDLAPCARALARLLPADTHALLVLFGPFCPGEIFVQLMRGDPRAAVRRFARSAPARLGGRNFWVHYPAPHTVARAFAPWFRLVRTRGIGVFVPPSATEPLISRFPRVLDGLEALDRLAAAPLSWLGDHVLLDLQRRSGAPPSP
ncbi:MAG: methyltransferase domain-containing protein [Longimicrobiales bacterium]